MSSTTTTANVASASAGSKKSAPSSAGRNLLGLFPYLARYPGAIVLGMVALVLTSVIGNIIPLATGVMTDIIAGSAHPFETSTHGNVLAGSWISRAIPFYAPRDRHVLGLYCLILVV